MVHHVAFNITEPECQQFIYLFPVLADCTIQSQSMMCQLRPPYTSVSTTWNPDFIWASVTRFKPAVIPNRNQTFYRLNLKRFMQYIFNGDCRKTEDLEGVTFQVFDV